ncbi:MAG: glycosyltransferase family 39 protein, partial [Propionibacteriales bacterium]|nr:glycosyltransferase family 39 protein [Propionibacteriales bacterium]
MTRASPPVQRNVSDVGWYAGAVVVGVVLIVIAAINQPFNQNELRQIAPYGTNTYAEITGGTRQPPLDPLLGVLIQHLLGEGQLRQRLVPVFAGIGTLIVMGLLMRRLGYGAAGAFGLWVMATAPLMVLYSAYTRPYALPLFLIVLFVYTVQRWFDERRVRWLAVTALAAIALPSARVPEPIMFLATTSVTLSW